MNAWEAIGFRCIRYMASSLSMYPQVTSKIFSLHWVYYMGALLRDILWIGGKL